MLQAKDEGAVILFLTQEVARSAAVCCFHLVKQGSGRELRIDTELPDLLVVRNQRRGFVRKEARLERRHEVRHEVRLAIRADEGGQAEIEQSQAVAVAGRDVNVTLFGTAFVQRVIDDQAAAAKSPGSPRESALAVMRQQE